MAQIPCLIFTSCCEEFGQVRFNTDNTLYNFIVNGDVYLYTGPDINGTPSAGSLISGIETNKCYTITKIQTGASNPQTLYPTTSTFLPPTLFNSDSCDSIACLDACESILPPPPLFDIITFTPCCNIGESIIFSGTIIGAQLVNNAVYQYNYLTYSGTSTGPLNINTINSPQCYRITFGTSTITYPALPLDFSANYFSTVQNNCNHPNCLNACEPEPEPDFGRYFIFTNCCTDEKLYFRANGLIQVPDTGVALYTGSLSGINYSSTDINGLPAGNLLSTVCYSISLKQVGDPTGIVLNMVQYMNLTPAPVNNPAPGNNYVYYSTTDLNCSNYTEVCPSCLLKTYKLWPCYDTDFPICTNTDLSAYVGMNIQVSYTLFNTDFNNICVFVELIDTECELPIPVSLNSNLYCECDCNCYDISFLQSPTIPYSISYVSCDIQGSQQVIQTQGISNQQICAASFPILNVKADITNNGPCVLINSSVSYNSPYYSCTTQEESCFELIDCENIQDPIFTNSLSLLSYPIGTIVVIDGYPDTCWIINDRNVECDCAIDVIILQNYESCIACLDKINYKLTNCDDENIVVYTSSDLSLYVNQVVNREEDCPGCWIVEEVIGDIPSDIIINITDSYINCIDCKRVYYILEDCANIENDIITHTDLSDYINLIIKLEWCPETCWKVSLTNLHLNSGVVHGITNVYDECIECLTNFHCICSTITNNNKISYTYNYIDCFGLNNSVTLLPNETSERVCLIKWVLKENCDCIIITSTENNISTSEILYQSSTLINNRPSWNRINTNDVYIYFDGSKWIMNNLLLHPEYYLTDCNDLCPIGTWKLFSSIPVASYITKISEKCQQTVQIFGDCINGVCPLTNYNKKTIKPGYNTPGCEIWKYEEISCRAAEAIYKQVLELRYGISNCCPEEDEQYIVQKELIDLAALCDPSCQAACGGS